ncbi:MAG: hydroxymethylbilane synthase [Kiritimatiellia bacterium]
MTKTSATFKVGTRNSRLSLLQTGTVVEHLGRLFPAGTFDVHPSSSPGDRDQAMDLRISPADFFTHDLDEAVLRGDLDFAIHSAKDMPDPSSAGLDWFWLPWHEDPRDCLVLPAGWALKDLPREPRIGVSSERRAAYCRQRFPHAQILPVRGNIDERLAQLDAHKFDAILSAGCALIRLGLEARISEWIPRDALPPPAGQGWLGISFRAGDRRMIRLRSLFAKPVVFAGAGAGRAGMCTQDGLSSLKLCEVCLHDALIDPALLAVLPADAVVVNAGKRAGDSANAQDLITEQLLRYARRGHRVVRLKGGDPGIFGRLAEETQALEALGLPYRVIPGVSALNTATTGTGMLPTRRGAAQGFCAVSARAAGGADADMSGPARSRLPVIAFMAGSRAASVAKQLLRDGWPSDTPMAMIYAAGTEDEEIVAGTLDRCPALKPDSDSPCLLVCGEAAAHQFRRDLGPLRGKRVLLTFSESLMEPAMQAVRDYGGVPVARPMIRVSPCTENDAGWAQSMQSFDAIALTSPSAVDCMIEALRRTKTDLRTLPPVLLVSGPAVAARLEFHGLYAAECTVGNSGCETLLDCAARHLRAGQRVLRLRSDRAGDGLANRLREQGFVVDDVVLYRNTPICYEHMPRFDMAAFASGSGVESFIEQWGPEALAGKIVAAFSGSAASALARAGIPIDAEIAHPSAQDCIRELALHELRKSLEETI